MTLAGGRAIQLSLTSAAATRDKGNVVALLQDVTSQQDTENALNISAARLLALTEATPVATMIENVDGEIELANEAFCRLLGLELAPQSLTGVSAAETIGNAEGAAKLLQRQSIMMDEEPAGAMWLGREAAKEAAAAVKGVAEVALIEKIAMELSVAMEGIAAVSSRASDGVDPESCWHSSDRGPPRPRWHDRDCRFLETCLRVVLHKREFRACVFARRLVSGWSRMRGHRCRCASRSSRSRLYARGDVERLQLVLKNPHTAFVLSQSPRCRCRYEDT